MDWFRVRRELLPAGPALGMISRSGLAYSGLDGMMSVAHQAVSSSWDSTGPETNVMRLFSAVVALSSVCTLFSHHVRGQDASDLIQRAKLHRGICCVLGVGDGTLPMALAQNSEMLIISSGQCEVVF